MALGTIITGVKGSVTIPVAAVAFTTTAVDSRITRWAMNIVSEEHNTTTFAVTNNWHTWAGGMATGTGRCEGFLDSGEGFDVTVLNTEDRQPTASFVLTATTGKTYTFSALLGNIDLGIDKLSHSAMAFTFRISGPVVVA